MGTEKKLSRGMQLEPASGIPSSKHSKANGEPLAKRPKLMTDLGDSEWSSSETKEPVFKINEEFARRFEHNKKREELHRLEEKYGSSNGWKRKEDDGDDKDSNGSNPDTSSSSEDDDEGVLVTEQLDAEISATLQALRAKDPRVYDKKATFYSDLNETEEDGATLSKADKPMFLRDYHRKNLLEGCIGQDEDNEDNTPRTYAQEQEDLKKTVVKEMHAALDEELDDGDDDGFLVAKKKTKIDTMGTVANGKIKKITEADIAIADKDPELFLSNFMSARAWVPTDSSQFKPFESDDDEEDDRAEIFEQAYNLRFEDPKGSNEKLMTHSRQAAARYSFRREELSGRKKARETQRQKKEEERRQRDKEKARLRKLKIEEVEEKVRKIKGAAGLRGKAVQDESWSRFLEDRWDDNNWEQEMNKRFGDSYYAQVEDIEDGDDGERSRERKVKKPKWDDDIDIKDLVPDFEDPDVVAQTAFDLSDKESDEDGPVLDTVDSDINVSGPGSRPKKGKSKKDRLQERLDKKKQARKERKRIEQLVDEKLDLDLALPSASSSKIPTRFRYRETSPEAFGLTPKDILLASDGQLNQFVSLKKMAAFRDPEKKRKDKKKLGKKARLRQWRRETFGDENGPVIQHTLKGIGVFEEKHGEEVVENEVDIREGHKKRKRSRKG